MGELINIRIAKVPKGTVKSGRTGGVGSTAVLRIENKDAEFAARAGHALHADDADHAVKADLAKEAERLTSGALSGLDDRFLSKRKNDSTPYDLGVRKITARQGFEAGNYLAGVSGGMFGIDKTDNQSFADVFKLWVRGKAYFETLTIIEAATLAGKQYITPGGAVKCTMVEEVKDAAGSVTAYRCWFLSEQDGEKTETKIVAGDQAISEMFNAKTGTANKVSNHRYWRLVTAVNNDAATDDAGNHYGYIDLSASDCDTGSDVPQDGDVIAHLGNRTDPTRQAAMVFSTVDPDSPSVKLLTGIDHYTLVGKDIISQGYDHVKGHAYMRCHGDLYLGDPDGSTYIRYDQDARRFEVNATLSVGSTVGGTTLGDLVENSEQSAVSVQILTDKGNVILNGEGQRMLTAYVSFRNEDVTYRIYDGRFSWKRTSDDTTGDKIWNRLHEGIGRHCAVTDEDIDRNAVFTCEVDLSGTWLDPETDTE